MYGGASYINCFNPRTHVGCDCVLNTHHLGIVTFQSTHPRRVRHPEFRNYCPRSWFQSTHPRRVRLTEPLNGSQPPKFQSTHPRRVRLNMYNVKQTTYSFNPRTHVGCDRRQLRRWMAVPWFQSTHPRRVRRRVAGVAVVYVEFQSTHPRRVRHNKAGLLRLRSVSIHAPT